MLSDALRSASWRLFLLASGRSCVTLGCDVEVRPSSPLKGQGVFALRDLPKGTLLSRYTGRYYDSVDTWMWAPGAGEE